MIGHRYKNPDGTDYFGAVDSTNIPSLQHDITSLLHHNGFEGKIVFKYYVCSAAARLCEMRDRMHELQAQYVDQTRTQTITVKSSPCEIVPNPLFENIRMGLRPEANKYKGKYQNKAIPSEHRLSTDEMQRLEPLNRRVLACEMPQEFKASNLKSTASSIDVADKFKDSQKRNVWKEFTVQP